MGALRLIKNALTAALHLPPVKNKPEWTLPPGVSPIRDDEHWESVSKHPMVSRWLDAKIIVVIDSGKVDETPKVAEEDWKNSSDNPKEAVGEGVPVQLPPLPTTKPTKVGK